VNGTENRSIMVLTLDILDLTGAESSGSPLVFGSGDACRAYRALDIHNGSAGRWATLVARKLLLGSHLERVCCLISYEN
jgi:hypothetical protein